MTVEDIRLILRLSRGDAAGVARCLASRETSLAGLVDTALGEGLAVVLLRAVDALPPVIELSAGHLEALRARKQRQDARSAVLLEALGRIDERFAAAGQAFLLLKGPYLAARFYGDIQGREFVDLDLLVPARDRQRASRLVESAGYHRRSRVVGGEAVTSAFVHGFDFAAGDANLDLHWRLSRHPSLRIDEARLWNSRQAFAVRGRTYGVLSDEHEVVFESLSLLRDIERGRPKAKNAIDIIQVAAAADPVLDWDGVFARARGEGTYGPVVNVLSLCLDVADAHDLAPHLSATLERHAVRRIPGRPADAPFRFLPLGRGLGDKWWSARAHDTTPMAWLLWWAASLPFRIAVHRRPVRRLPPAGIEDRP